MYIQGEKVLLRAIELDDLEILRAMINDADVESMMWGYSFPVSENEQRNWINSLSNNDTVFRGIIEAEGRGIGEIILTDIDLRNGNSEIHIKLAGKEVRGKGYGTDAVKALVTYCFNELRLNCVYCRIKDDNIASQKLFSKCGFIKEGVLRERVYKNGGYHDFYEYSILKGEFEGVI